MSAFDQDHPIFSNRYLLPTNSIEELLNAIVQWLDINSTGAIVYGVSRSGKTEAINFIRGRLSEVLDSQIPSFIIEGTDELSNTTSATFWSAFLEDVGSPYPYLYTARMKRNRAINYVRSACINCGSSRAILFIDDAQWFSVKEYGRLIDLQKQLLRNNIDLVVILVGQEDLALKREQLSGTSKWPIIGRFMHENFHFRGCNLDDDLKRILNAYDEETEHPIGSGISYTQSLVSQAWNSGFRLIHIHKPLAESIEKTRLKMTSGVGLTEYPMAVIRRICNALLKEFSKRDSADFEPSIALIERCVQDYCGAMLGVNYDDLY